MSIDRSPLARRAVCLVGLFLAVGCSGTTDAGPTPNPTPVLSRLSPERVFFGELPSSMTLTGEGFMPQSRVTWNGVSRTATFVSASELLLPLTALDVLDVGTAQVVVSNPTPGGGVSSPVTFAVVYPAPVFASISPASAFVDDAALRLSIQGTGFSPASTIQWNGAAIPTQLVSPTALRADIAPSMFAQAGDASITVVTPSPGGGTAGPMTLSVLVPSPSLASISPSTASIGVPFTLTVTGARFVSGTLVHVNGTPRATTVVSSSLLHAEVVASDVAALGALAVTVVNPSPGGGASQPMDITVRPLMPILAQMTPTSTIVGSAGFSLTVSGANFQPGMMVLWNGEPRPTNYVSATALTATIAAADLLSVGNVTIAVRNPVTGDVSGSLVFAVLPAAPPQITFVSPNVVTTGPGPAQVWVYGTNFRPSQYATWNGARRTTTVASSTAIYVALAPSDFAVPQSGMIAVYDSVTKQTSGSLPITVVLGPAPQISSLSPTAVPAGCPAFTLTILGSNFVQGSVVRWGSRSLTVTYASSGLLQARVLASDIATVTSVGISVTNPATNQTSNVAAFSVGSMACWPW